MTALARLYFMILRSPETLARVPAHAGQSSLLQPMKAPHHSLNLQGVQACILAIGRVRWSTFIQAPPSWACACRFTGEGIGKRPCARKRSVGLSTHKRHEQRCSGSTTA